MSDLISQMDPKSELNDMMGNVMISNDAQPLFFKIPENMFRTYNRASYLLSFFGFLPDVGLSKVLKDAFATISDNNLNLHVVRST